MNWYDKGGALIDVATASELLGNAEYKRVGLTEVASGDRSAVHIVSTVWLGLDHNYGDGPPLLFETMVFGEGSWAEQDCQRYSTELEARIGHTEMVALVAATVPDEAITELPAWPEMGGAA
ncbi:hypothetical protein [Streptomyces ortus]|uniref:Uncharacterized protein n=1 Tax=Streptomyces ortus TaxID=2867268 RepID=A0ABT3V159_9ACTN|nr:hypothetical protein [Streptomyces ortus]MCX4232111.1 hypothetical protein [Streptomyces ortus]